MAAQKVAGIEPLRRVYDLRHTFATFALRAGISTFDLKCVRAAGSGAAGTGANPVVSYSDVVATKLGALRS